MSSHSPRRWLRATVYAVIVLTILGMVGALATAQPVPASTAAPAVRAAQSPQTPQPVILLVTEGLSWSDVEASPSSYPALIRELASGRGANLVAKTAARPQSGRSSQQILTDGWRTLGAGARASADTTTAYTSDPDALARALKDAGASIAAIGEGACDLLAADPSTTCLEGLEQLQADALPALTVIDATSQAGSGVDYRGASQVEQALASLEKSGISGEVRLIVLSLADADGGVQAAIFPAGTRGAGDDGATAGSLLAGLSTHQPGFVQLTDIAPTVVTALGLDMPASMVGSALTLPDAADAHGDAEAAASQLDDLADLALRARISQMTTLPLSLLLILPVVLLAGVVMTGRMIDAGASGALNDSGRRCHARAQGLIYALLVWECALPLGIWLAPAVPYWRIGVDEPGVQAQVIAAAGVIAAVLAAVIAAGAALVARALTAALGRALPGIPVTIPLIGFLTALVIMVDGAWGARFGFNGALGMDAIVAGRFYGVSNTAFALAAGALVVALTSLLGRPTPAGYPAPAGRSGRMRPSPLRVAVAGLALAVVILDAAPGLGADVGGALTLTVTLSALALWIRGIRIGWRRAIAIAALAFVTVGGCALADWATGPRTHLGRFVTAVGDGSAGSVIARKAGAIIQPFLTSPTAAAALVGALACLVVVGLGGWRARSRWKRGQASRMAWIFDAAASLPWLPACLKGLAVLMLVEAAVNDSGLTMAVFSAVAAVPAILAALVAYQRR